MNTTNFGPYSLRGLRSCKARNGCAWSATLLRDGKPAADIIETGSGEPLRIEYKPDEARRLGEHVATLPPRVDEWGGRRHEYAVTPDIFLAALADYADAITRARRLLRSRVVLIVEGSARTAPSYIKPLPAWIAKYRDAHGDAVIDPAAPDAVERVARALCGGAA